MKLNVEALSDTARVVLSTFALFDTAPVPEQLVGKLDPRTESDAVVYLEVVRKSRQQSRHWQNSRKL